MRFKDKKFVKPSKETQSIPTQHLYLSGLGQQLGTSRSQLHSFLSDFGPLQSQRETETEKQTETETEIESKRETETEKEIENEVLNSNGETEIETERELDDGLYMPADRRYCVASFQNVSDAVKAHTFFEDLQQKKLKKNQMEQQELEVEPELEQDEKEVSDELGAFLRTNKVMARFANVFEERGKCLEPECTSSTDAIVVPGLYLIEEFISEEEEARLMEEIGNDNAPWKESLNRRVQHYGFVFNYKTVMVDYAKPALPIPVSCKELADRIVEESLSLTDVEASQVFNLKNDTGKLPPLNQLTVNEYVAGQGIASHTDTETCFGSILYSLSIGSGIVMNFTQNKKKSNLPNVSNVSVDEDNSQPDGGEQMVRKYVYLPPRSMLIISGDARYFWSHGISPRRFDKVNGALLSRGRRISLTFRHVVKPGPIPASQLLSGRIEQEHVVKVYDEIAVHWNHTRGKRKVHWHRVKDFLDSLPPGTLLADVGSGDGKYFGVNPNVCTIGCDRSSKLLEVSHEPSHETFCCDGVKLPFVDGMFDAVVCIAVLHHMANVDRRYAVISELVRIARFGGEIMIQAWALEQDKSSKHVFLSQDTMVPWKLNRRFAIPGSDNHVIDSNNNGKANSQDDIVVYERYCHVYKEGELEDLCSRVPNCRVIESGWDKGNWFVRILKVEDDRLVKDSCGPEAKIPALVPRNLK